MNKSIEPPGVFYQFTRRMFQDYELFDTRDDLIRFGLRGIARGDLGEFIAFVDELEKRRVDDDTLEQLWAKSPAEFYITGRGQVLAFLRHAADIARAEGPSGLLYRRKIGMKDL